MRYRSKVTESNPGENFDHKLGHCKCSCWHYEMIKLIDTGWCVHFDGETHSELGLGMFVIFMFFDILSNISSRQVAKMKKENDRIYYGLDWLINKVEDDWGV